jgi:hypothetical protein
MTDPGEATAGETIVEELPQAREEPRASRGEAPVVITERREQHTLFRADPDE